MISSSAAYPHSDLALARRLERAEARANAAFVEARALLEPESRAAWIEVAGAYAMFDGIGSPLTQSFGLGLFDDVGEPELRAVETFFRERGAGIFHEVCPLAPQALLALLGGRGYRPIEWSSVLYRPVAAQLWLNPAVNPWISVRRIEPVEADLWAAVAAEGWSTEAEGLSSFVRQIGRISARSQGSHSFLAELEGRPIAAAALNLGDGVAPLAGASTIPRGRKQGAQLALLEARMRLAAEQGCALAMMCASPGSVSQRNAERQGFRIAYTRIKWQLHAATR